MKKLILSAAAALLLAFGARADEGMWLLPLLQKMNINAMNELGCKLSAEDIYSINNTSLKDAIVQFGGGCTGEIISDKGLLVTNHHCGYGSIQSLSTPEHNYLEDGYWAMNNAQELPVPGLSVKFLKAMKDVTKIVQKHPEKKQELVKEAEQDYPGCEASVVSFYNDNVNYLIVYAVYKDIRFVGAPPACSGKFGGETDNWMWPRHTCDFSMFRVYAGKDNQPAEYSEDNVPYTPARSLKISLKGIQDGDYAMIMGYPGRTSRFKTASQLKANLATNDISIEARTLRQKLMWEAMEADPTVRLQYASKYAGSSNGWKKWIGMKKAVAKLKIVEREAEKEAEFMKWVGKNKKRTEKYGYALDSIDFYVNAMLPSMTAITRYFETVGRIELFDFADTFESIYKKEVKNGSSEADALKAAFDKVAPLYKDYYEPLDRLEAASLSELYNNNSAEENRGEINVGYLFDNSVFTNVKKLEEAVAKGHEAIAADPAVTLSEKGLEIYRRLYKDYGKYAKRVSALSKVYTAGMLEWQKDQPSYPDANFTMRLTYGTVKSYEPKDGVLYKHYTTLDGVMEKKDNSNYEFRVPAKLEEVWKAKDFGDYAMPENGKVPACFLINCDITGGNSGSPVMDAEGNLIGLAFDGNWESMSSDIMFEPDLQRCICVDIRYVLLLMDKVGGAGYLRDEMNIVK
ncbi:MAG: S46 family peptidase [Bacteroidales bacterium]|nr:S46 family peptidase [Bacteroidales bacterium]